MSTPCSLSALQHGTRVVVVGVMLLKKPGNQSFGKVPKQTVFTNVHTVFQYALADLAIVVVPINSDLYEILPLPTKAKAQIAFFAEWWRGVVQTKADDRFNSVKNIRNWITAKLSQTVNPPFD